MESARHGAQELTGTPLSRRTVLKGAATVGVGAAAVGTGIAALTPPAEAATASQRTVYNLNIDWKFTKADPAGAEAVAASETGWTTVSVPHTFNDVDSFDEFITSSGEAHLDRRIVWYRKHFTIPAGQAGHKVFFECEGIRQAATVYVNGVQVGLYEGGVVPFGFDITNHVMFGAPNVIAIKADNSASYAEKATGTTFQWDSRDFNPNYGGLTRNVRLVVTSKTYFTAPLFRGLKTTGTYIYPSNVNVPGMTATVNVESQVRNEAATARTVTVSANVLKPDGTVQAAIPGTPITLAAGATQIVKLSQRISRLSFWQPGRPTLYTVEMVLTENGVVQDTYPILTGFRKAEFRGGVGTGGVYINDKFSYLSGYAQRSTNEWALIGGAVPEWLRDYDGQLIRDSNAKLIRWMHISAQPSDIRMTDRYGIVSVQPAGDKESDATGRQWDQRVETMRDSMIYFRNSPSILFYEAGNNWITPAHMQQMTNLRKVWDPNGMRVVGCRAISDDPAYGGKAVIDAAEYVGTMLNRHYSDYARDKMPIIECEYTRDEAPRRVWDNASPPDFGYKFGPMATYHWTSEDFAGTVAASTRFEFWGQRIQGPGNQRYSGAAALVWSDSNMHGRQYGTETSRLSGRVDALRLPKESFYTHRVMQSPVPAIHVIGHWSYPARTKKTMYVMAAHVARVSMFVNGAQVATSSTPTFDYLYTFANVAFKAGTIAVVGFDAAGTELVRQEKFTAGAAVALKLTPHTAPGGLRADGADVFFVDVEVVDANGRRVPTDQARVDFAVTGPGVLLGSYNSGIEHSVFTSFANTECGINRVFIRGSRRAGTITLTATRKGLTSGSTQVASSDFALVNGLTTHMPATYQ